MDKLRSLNVAGKITDGFKNFNSKKITAFFTYLVVVLVIIAALFAIYLYLLEKGDLDIVFHEKGISLSSEEKKNIAASNLPTVSSSAYTLNAWFAVDKSQYIEKQNAQYSHLISYGRTRVKQKNETSDPYAMGVYIDNKTNNLLIVYRTEGDDLKTYYNPNNNLFNSKNTVTLKNYLLNEWNLITLVADSNNLMVYLNGQLYETKVNNENMYYKSTKPLLNINVGRGKKITGKIKNIRFRDYAYQADEVADLYFSGPTKFVLPDIRDKTYLDDVDTDFDVSKHVGSTQKAFLDSGADLIDSALGGMNDFFKQF
jgi:hypothetical protein